ncbi:MAG: DNA repair protein RadC [Longimicrobiaceae bacterium]
MPYTIKHWPVHDRPRERARTLGPQALSTRELLALLIETGMPARDGVPGCSALELAGALLGAFAEDDGTDSLRRLMAAPVASVAGRVRGIGPAKAAKILAALELGRRAADEARPDRDRVNSSRDIYERMRVRLRDLDHEEFYLILLNTQNDIIREVFLARGTLDSALVHAREVFRHALNESASAVVLVHNHPSGESAPSLDDRRITQNLVKAGEMLGIPLYDHVIIGERKYYSFRDHDTLYSGVYSLTLVA